MSSDRLGIRWVLTGALSFLVVLAFVRAVNLPYETSCPVRVPPSALHAHVTGVTVKDGDIYIRTDTPHARFEVGSTGSEYYVDVADADFDRVHSKVRNDEGQVITTMTYQRRDTRYARVLV